MYITHRAREKKRAYTYTHRAREEELAAVDVHLSMLHALMQVRILTVWQHILVCARVFAEQRAKRAGARRDNARERGESAGVCVFICLPVNASMPTHGIPVHGMPVNKAYFVPQNRLARTDTTKWRHWRVLPRPTCDTRCCLRRPHRWRVLACAAVHALGGACSARPHTDSQRGFEIQNMCAGAHARFRLPISLI